MSEMIATANAKSIEEIKSFLSKQKETYKIPYETHPADRLRQCVFAGTTNRQDFLPRERTGNRRFIPIPVDAELAEVHILDNEEESRTYIDQLCLLRLGLDSLCGCLSVLTSILFMA